MRLVPRTREEALGKVEQELRKEQASSLGRVAARLEGLLADLAAIEATLATLEGEARAPLLRQHAAVRKEAELYRWYLEVQREAMGIRRQGDLDQYYRLPAPMRE